MSDNTVKDAAADYRDGVAGRLPGAAGAGRW